MQIYMRRAVRKPNRQSNAGLQSLDIAKSNIPVIELTDNAKHAYYPASYFVNSTSMIDRIAVPAVVFSDISSARAIRSAGHRLQIAHLPPALDPSSIACAERIPCAEIMYA